VLTCDVIEPSDGKGYDRDPRSIAKRAEAYLKSTGIGDTAYFGPEPEFFIFDSVDLVDRHVRLSTARSSPKKPPGRPADKFEGGNIGHRPRQGRLFPGTAGRFSSRTSAPPWCWRSSSCGVPVEVFHHEVATAGQCEIGTKFSTLTKRADWTQC
jgi:glutamine synthetase